MACGLTRHSHRPLAKLSAIKDSPRRVMALMARSVIPLWVMLSCVSTSVPAAQRPIRLAYIHHRLVPQDLHAFIGEGIRWINGRKTPIRLEIEGPYGLGRSCQSVRSRPVFHDGLVLIAPGHYVESYFSQGGVIPYKVWLEQRNQRSPNLSGRIYLDATV